MKTTADRGRLTKADRAALDMIAVHGYAQVRQIAGWKSLAHRGLIRIELVNDQLCCFITDKGREALK